MGDGKSKEWIEYALFTTSRTLVHTRKQAGNHSGRMNECQHIYVIFPIFFNVMRMKVGRYQCVYEHVYEDEVQLSFLFTSDIVKIHMNIEHGCDILLIILATACLPAFPP